MAEKKKWTKLGARVCALSLTALMALMPAVAQAMTLNINYEGGTLAVHGTDLKEGLEETPISITVEDENGVSIFSDKVTSTSERKFYQQFNLTGLLKDNATYTVKAKGEKKGEEKTTVDEASRQFTTPAAVIADIALATPSKDDSAQSATISGTAQDGKKVVVSLSGAGSATQTVTANGGSFTATFTGLNYGDYSVSAQYEDSSLGGKGASTSFTLVKPVAALNVSASGGQNVAIVTVTGEPGTTVTAVLDGQTLNTTLDASGAYSFTFTNVKAGTHTVQVSDSVGQSSSTSVTVAEVPVQIVQKDIAVTAIQGGVEMATIEGTASPGAVVSVSGFGKQAAVTVSSDGKFSCVFTGVTPATYNAISVGYVDTTTYTGKSAGVSGNWTVTAQTVQNTNIAIVGTSGGQGTIQVTGTAKAGETLAVLVKNEATAAEVAIAATADASGNFTQTVSNLAAGSYTVTVSYQNVSVGASASRSGVVVSAVPSVKAGITLDKLYESSLTVVGKTSANCNVTVKVTYNGKEVSISRVSGSDGIFRIPLPRTLPKHTQLTATVTYSDGTTESTTGYIYAGSAAQEYNVTYRTGSVGNGVYDLEWQLQQLGYPITPDRVYDSQTENIVRIFQRNNGLSIDGMAGPATLTKLYSVTAVGYSSSSTDDYIYLARGSRGSLVSQIQTRLKELGYYTIRVDGIFGVGTQTAVRAFQRNNGLSVTGVVNSECYKAIMASNAVGVGGTGSTSDDYVELRYGNRGAAVVRLQSRLQYLGYYTISVDGIYGSGTQTAVRRFQSRNGISANGVASVYTQQVLFSSSAVANSSSTSSSSTSTGYVYLHYGSNGTAVRRLQQALKNAGYYKGAIDGQYYDQTYAAVKAFQRAAGLSVDGIAGRKTQNALYGTNY